MAFSLADMLKEVSNPDTGREQIEYIRLDLIDSDVNNFYQLSDIEGLADNISFAGLQQPIRVRKNTDNDRYTIISGHRRRAAIELLAKDEPEKWQEVSCIIQQETGSPALQQLQLIFANSSTRKLTPNEIAEQTEQVKNLLYQLKEEGYEFPGRMRDHVAEIVGQSRTKIARLEAIRKNLADFWMPHFKDNSLHESTAYYLSQLSGEDQYVVYEYAMAKYNNATSISCSVVETYGDRLRTMVDLICPTEGIPCENMDNKKDATIRCGIYDHHPCGKCCASCYKLTFCRYACPKLADQIAHQKEEARKKQRQEKAAAAAAQAAKDAPIVEQIKNLWVRFGDLRRGSSRSIKEAVEAVGNTFSSPAHQQYCDHEQGLKIDRNTGLPYGSVLRNEVENLIKLADLFGCSLDYLLCRTDDPDPKLAGNVLKSDTEEKEPVFIPGAWYAASVEPPVGKKLILMDSGGYVDTGKYKGCGEYDMDYGDPVVLWTLMPEEKDVVTSSPVSHGWNTGNPESYGTYVAYVLVDGAAKPIIRELLWDGECWYLHGDQIHDDVTVQCWAERPEF